MRWPVIVALAFGLCAAALATPVVVAKLRVHNAREDLKAERIFEKTVIPPFLRYFIAVRAQDDKIVSARVGSLD